MLKTDGIKLFTGIVFSNVAGAIVPDIVDSGAHLCQPQCRPVELRRQGVQRELLRHVLADRHACRAAPARTRPLSATRRPSCWRRTTRPARTRSTGFKRFFKGEIVGEVYTRLDQTDFAAEMAQIRAAKPDVVFQFHPGGLGIAFLRQYQQAGLLGKVPMVLAEPSMDHTMLKTVGDAALGIDVSGHWNTDFDNPVNKKFVEAFTKAYGRTPTMYAAQGYDTALAIASALQGDRRQGRRRRCLPQGDAEGGLPVDPRRLQVRHEPASGAGLVRDEGRAGCRRASSCSRPASKILSEYGDPYAAALQAVSAVHAEVALRLAELLHGYLLSIGRPSIHRRRRHRAASLGRRRRCSVISTAQARCATRPPRYPDSAVDAANSAR